VSLKDNEDSNNKIIAGEKDDPSSKGELEVIVESLSDKASLISKSALKEWDEIRNLIDEGLLGERTSLRTCGRQP